MTLHLKRLASALLILAFTFTAGHALADTEPTLNQVYAAAQAGKLDEAQLMMQQVLVSHPNSAKAHFVRAELFARQGKMGQAREALVEAERLAPGLPFAKPDAVRALRSQLADTHSTALPAGAAYAATAAGPSAAAPTSWLLPLLLAVGVIVVGYLLFRRRAPAQPVYAAETASLQPAYGGAYGQPAYGQPASTGLGSQIMGGVATGLAVGAGVVAAEAIGRRLLGENETHAHATDTSTAQTYQPVFDGNADMGGQNFGVNDAGAWDDAGSAGDGGSWDS